MTGGSMTDAAGEPTATVGASSADPIADPSTAAGARAVGSAMASAYERQTSGVSVSPLESPAEVRGGGSDCAA